MEKDIRIEHRFVKKINEHGNVHFVREEYEVVEVKTSITEKFVFFIFDFIALPFTLIRILRKGKSNETSSKTSAQSNSTEGWSSSPST